MKQMTRREFIKCAAAFSATAAGIPPFNLSLTDTVERRSGELVVYPFLYRFVNKSFQIINIKLWGCNWNCRWCTNKFAPLRNATPTILTINEITALVESAHLKMHLPTLLLVSGGEPLHQRIGALELIEWMKRNTDFVVGLETNGSLLDDEFIERANRLKLDRIDIAFRHIDDGWHRWYTGGHSNRRVVNALRLATETFDESISFKVEKTLVGLEGSIDAYLVTNSFTIRIPPLPPEPSKLSRLERRKYGITKITTSVTKGYAANLGLTPDLVERLINRWGSIYIAKRGVLLEKKATVVKTDLDSIGDRVNPEIRRMLNDFKRRQKNEI